jgi:iojap-like protein
MTEQEKLNIICKAIADKKGVQIRILHVSELTSIADYFILSTVRNQKQAQAAAEEVEEKMEEAGERPLRHEGLREGDWVLLDFGNIIVHIFTDEERRRYELDHLWGEAPVTEYHEPETEASHE